MKSGLVYKSLTILLQIVLCGGRDCYLACDQNQITYDKQLCYTNCDLKYIVGITVGSFIFLTFLICALCLCRNRNFSCIYFEKRRLRKMFNVVDPGDYTVEKFNSEKEAFIDALVKTEVVKIFFFKRFKQVMPMKIDKDSISLTEEPEQPFLSHIKFEGQDKYQQFRAQGSILCRQGQMFLWFMKQYYNSENVVKAGLKSTVVFESSSVNMKSWQGIWYCKGEELNEQLSGQWALVMKVLGANNRLQDIKAQLYMI